ncbi:MAG: cation transporter [Lachnospiraceae bacterium]|nr:cation transporter [Lachnospiraceae bacterium]
MIQLIIKLITKNKRQMDETKLRNLYGIICGWVGIGFNILLFIGKFFAGTLSKSVAITADAFNNLSDAGSSVITLLGFRLGTKKPDADHPYGHGRMEYVSGLIVSLLIFLMGFELLKDAIAKIKDPKPVETSWLIYTILILSILIKTYMTLYNFRYGNKINSAVLRATGMDSLSDCVATTVVLISMIVQSVTPWKIDGWCGLLVAGAVLYAAFGAAKDTLQPLLGMPPEQEFVDEIYKIVLKHPLVEGVHDLIVHDYGPGRCMISLHAEVPGDQDIYFIHDEIDRIEMELNEKLGCESTIHMDPIVVNDQKVEEYKSFIEAIILEWNQEYTIHDFRMVEGPTHTNIIFDVLIPRDAPEEENLLKESLAAAIKNRNSKLVPVIKIDRSYL